MTTQTTLGRRAALAAVYVERYGLSIVFLCLAGLRLHRIITMGAAERAELEGSPLVGIIREIIWVQLYVYVGLLLLVGRRVTTPPQNFKDLVLPVVTTFFNLIYSAVHWFPAALKQNLCPVAWQAPSVAVGLFLNLLGIWIAIWGAIYLGRSFGVLIEVRQVVLDGAYRRMRHPMYAGYICLLAGFALANFSLAYFILVPLHVFLLLYRARLEETRLAAASPEYQAYCQRTGFIFPKFGG